MPKTTAAPGGIDKIAEILNADTIFIPKSVLCRQDVYEESKLMFSVVFTQCLKEYGEDGFSTLAKEMKTRVHEMTESEIQFECFCSKSKAPVVRQEVLRLINHTNISSCLKERSAI